jgi:hypothetical protein
VTLGRLLDETARALLDLEKSVPSPGPKRQIADQLQQLLTLTARLVDANVDRATREYEAATGSLERARRALTAARSDLDGVTRAIGATAKAIDLLAKLAAVAA